ncbi:hypothetical protein [uncultured Polaribacter sp.]|uniref:hypothetical protein n=1 Tax=uncultured Polaribacter sp. TaxID=174711 RepID=UPI00261431E9|nr:hypothetical protein [uncultured Polaribacter sp.]
MKNLKYTFILAIAFSFLNVNAQEKKIKFNKGTLKICSSKNFSVKGYDGDEVIIKSIHDKSTSHFFRSRNNLRYPQVGTGKRLKGSAISSSINYQVRTDSTRMNKLYRGFGRVLDSTEKNNFIIYSTDSNRKKGLKKLGKENENKELGIYFIIERIGDELVFKDDTENQYVMIANEQYEIKIPNTLKLNWETNGCKKEKENTRKYVFFNSKASSLSNFNGEVEISTSLNNMRLVDVTGPVSINSIGGNITIEFDKKTPRKLYSVYSNNGFIDITIPSNSSLNLDATASDIFSDIDFNVQDEKEVEGLQKMKLKLNSGKVTMKLNAGLGNIYLRKK